MVRICIDPGHGGSDPGTIGIFPHRVEEKDFNLKTALKLELVLQELGHRVLMTRRVDRTLSLWARARFANRNQSDLFVSVHANAAADPSIGGIEVFNFPGSTRGLAAASRVYASLITRFPDHDENRGVKQANFVVLRETRMPAILVECEFLSNPSQLLFLEREETKQGIAEAIAAGVE